MFQNQDDAAGTRRGRNMAARRDRILSAAAGVLAESGPDGLSMRRLAERADVSVNTIYNLIGPRDAVVAALVDHVIQLIAPAVEHARVDDPLAGCVAVIDRSTGLVIEHRAFTRPLAQEIFGQGGPGSDVARRWGTTTLRRAIEEAAESGMLHGSMSPAAMTETVYAVWAHSALSWAHGAIDDDGFASASLYALHLALLAAASDASRPMLQGALGEVGNRLDTTLAAVSDPTVRQTT